jgi:hypothetical protein
MYELLSRMTSDELLALCGIFLGLVAIVGGLFIGLAAVISYHFRRSRIDDIEATLKLEMIHRGMSADEISKVLEARASECTPRPMVIGGNASRHGLRREFAKSGS